MTVLLSSLREKYNGIDTKSHTLNFLTGKWDLQPFLIYFGPNSVSSLFKNYKLWYNALFSLNEEKETQQQT